MIANRLTAGLARRLFVALRRRVVSKRPADFVIGGLDNPYMFRWWVIRRNRLLNVYLHCVVRDDDDRALHDHPWPSLSLCLAGHLAEVYRRGGRDRVRDFYPGDLVWRGARFAHRLYLPSGERYAWTLFITGPRVREWGFLCPRGWRHWKVFTGVATTGDSATIGRGCE
jgi:hypothetical protein